jgi:hypothetical protein
MQDVVKGSKKAPFHAHQSHPVALSCPTKAVLQLQVRLPNSIQCPAESATCQRLQARALEGATIPLCNAAIAAAAAAAASLLKL